MRPAVPPVVPPGTDLVVTTSQTLGSKTSQTGQSFLASVAQPVTVGGRSAIPKGSAISGTVVTAKEKGKVKGEGQIVSHPYKYHRQGANVSDSDQYSGQYDQRQGEADSGNYRWRRAAGGALIGGLAGGGKGAGIGALVGAGAGFVGGTLTGNRQIQLPAESALTFSLTAPLTLPPPPQ